MAIIGLLFLAGCLSALAYPPAPYHLVYGLVRDQYGTPIMNTQVQVVLQSPSGAVNSTTIAPGLAVGVINSPEEAFEDEHFKARGFHVPVRHDDLGRTIVYPGAPYKFEASPWRISRRAPRLGEHNDEVFAGLE